MALRAIVFLSNHNTRRWEWQVGARGRGGRRGYGLGPSSEPGNTGGLLFAGQLGKEETQYQETASCQLILRHYLNEGTFLEVKMGDV